jgi:enhancing lycopene biosynthesis protein 2
MAKRIGVLLSGCGLFDGSEIHEAVLTLLALDRAGVEIVCAAPDVNQYHVINHLTQEEMDETRNVLVESSRIARGNIIDLKSLHARDIDGLILPGGFGAVKNLSTFAFKGPDARIHPQVSWLLQQMHKAAKPIGAICISPTTVSMALKKHQPKVTIGKDTAVAAAINTIGGVHQRCDVDSIHVDSNNKIVSTPAYMIGQSIKDVAVGIDKLVQKVIALTET